MLILMTKKTDFTDTIVSHGAALPPDFYRFKHRTWVYRTAANPKGWASPLWIVGHSPFDTIIGEQEGHVVHLSFPRFTARWSMDEARLEDALDQLHHYDDDAGILVFEVSFIDPYPTGIEPWLREAACAVAFRKGLICELHPS